MDFKNGVVSVMSCSEAVSIKSCFSRDSTRIAKTYVLTIKSLGGVSSFDTPPAYICSMKLLK